MFNGYELHFAGKNYAQLQAAQLAGTLLVPDTEHNSKPENTDSKNVFITGDNLEALRQLQHTHCSKVNIIYIDPPYNTGKQFVYADKFELTDEQLMQFGYDAGQIKHLKSLQGKNSHSAWLTFMYPRLKLAQKLLTDDGIIFVSIDDSEQANLKILMDEVFGEENFAANFIWQDKHTTTNDKRGISSQTEYILAYAKDANLFVPKKLPLREDYVKKSYHNPDNDPKGMYMTVQTYKKKNRYTFEVVSPAGKIWSKPWNFTKENFERLDKEGRIFWGADGNACPRKKVYLSESTGSNPANLLLGKEFGFTGAGGDEIEELFQNRPLFLYPKNTKLLKHLIRIGAAGNAIVLDFFAGSGTTAHAVMQLNAEDGGRRQWILVQIDEPVNKNSTAGKAGYQTIDEIARERIKRAAVQIRKQNPKDRVDISSTGFKHYRLK